jgi:hypothetical protein
VPSTSPAHFLGATMGFVELDLASWFWAVRRES